VPLSMSNWKSSAEDASRTPSQTESSSTPEAIQDQQSSGGPFRTLSLLWDTYPNADRRVCMGEAARVGVRGQLGREHSELLGPG
jgi:hypothetical protein